MAELSLTRATGRHTVSQLSIALIDLFARNCWSNPCPTSYVVVEMSHFRQHARHDLDSTGPVAYHRHSLALPWVSGHVIGTRALWPTGSRSRKRRRKCNSPCNHTLRPTARCASASLENHPGRGCPATSSRSRRRWQKSERCNDPSRPSCCLDL